MPTTTRAAAPGVEAATLQMVEAFVREHTGEYDRDPLWQMLPGQVPYARFSEAPSVLIETARVDIDAAGKVCYVYNPR